MTTEQRDLLLALAYLYLRHGQARRALTLALLAARGAPDHIGVLRLLAYAFLANEAPEEALETIERLERLDFSPDAARMHQLLKARALLHAGRRVEARAAFRRFVAARQGASPSKNGLDQEVAAGLEGAIADGGDLSSFPAEEAAFPITRQSASLIGTAGPPSSVRGEAGKT